MNYSVLGISSGIGVSLHPFRNQVVGNIESRAIFHSPKEDQWEANFPGVPLYRNLLKELPTDVIIGSPDCGSSSILRMSRSKVYGDHKDNHSLLIFIEGIKRYQPKFFLLENLPGLFKSFPKKLMQEEVGHYRLICHEAPVSMWGNSQVNRKRLVIVGIRNDLPTRIDKYFKLPDYRERNKTCKDLYGDLDEYSLNADSGHIREDSKEMCTIHGGRKIPIWEIIQTWQTELKNERRWKVKGHRFTTAPGVYRNRLNDYPSTARKANRQFDHHGKMLTPRQLARIQGVPDTFVLVVKRDKLNYWLNKARAVVTKTPPYEISLWFKRKLDKTFHLWSLNHQKHN